VDAEKGTISFKVDRASFPNWDDTTRVTTFTLAGDTLTWRTPSRPDGSIPVTILKRATPKDSSLRTGPAYCLVQSGLYLSIKGSILA
jgi:hypothetical protein